MNDKKKTSEMLDTKELLTRQLQLVSKESENAHGEELAHLSEAMGCLSNALMCYTDLPVTMSTHDANPCR